MSVEHEVTIRGGVVVTEEQTMRVDIGIVGGKIVTLAPSLPAGGVEAS